MADTTITVNKPKNGAKKSKGHKGKQQSHNKTTGKYDKQKVRTARNKARTIAKAKLRSDATAGVSVSHKTVIKTKKAA